MGEVYRARDTRLDRTVAVKILTQGVADTPEVRQRFEREARAVSSLSHPHICVLYDVGNQDGIEYLVMEYLEGRNAGCANCQGPAHNHRTVPLRLADRRRSRQSPPAGNCPSRPETRQRDAHQDPAPSSSTSAWRRAEKILQGDPGSSPTMSRPLTMQGSIVGTMQYMSPEQLEGKDSRRAQRHFFLRRHAL